MHYLPSSPIYVFFCAVLYLFTIPFSRLYSQTGCNNNSGVIWVTNAGDSGTGSLREAIDCANTTPGRDSIRFSIPGGGQHVIQVGSTTGLPLPTLLDAGIILDASTQTGFGNNGNYQPRIILDGSAVAWTAPVNAIFIQADSCGVFAFEIRNFPDDGIDVLLASYCTIGAAGKGNVIRDCGIEQDYFPDSNSGPWDGCGIVIRGGDHCIVQGNTVGTNYAQTIPGGIEYCGILVRSSSDSIQIGGALPGQGNIIAYNKVGIRLSENSFYCSMRLNQMYCNDSIAIEFRQNSNSLKSTPVFTSITSAGISGTASNGDVVDVFLADIAACAAGICQGKTWLGSAIVTGNNWQLTPPYANNTALTAGGLLTAIATSPAGSSSRFASCYTIPTLCSLTASAVNITNTSCGLNNGSFAVNAAGGAAPYTYTMNNNSSSNPFFANLSPGNFTVTVTDAVGCSISFGVTILTSVPMNAAVSNITPAGCGMSNGGFTILSTGGNAPYSYNIGNGPTGNPFFSGLNAGTYTVTVSDATGCTQTVTATVAATPPPSVNIANIQQATCSQQNGGFTVTTTGGLAPFTYNIGTGATLNPVFSGLSPGTYNITVTDSNGCNAFATVTIVNAGQPPVTGFSYAGDQLTVSFSATGGTGQSYLWQFGDGAQSTQANPVHIYADGGDYEVCLTANATCGSETYCELITLMEATVSLSGHIQRETQTPIGNVAVFCPVCSDTATTNSEGDYFFTDIPAGTTTVLTPYKNSQPVNGVTSYDLYLISRHILNIELLNSPYKIIAADANRNNAVTANDLLEIQKLILGYTTAFANNTSWRFVDASYDFPNPANPFLFPFPESITQTMSGNVSDAHFIAVKTGDVNNNASPNPLQGISEERSGDIYSLTVSSRPTLENGSIPFAFNTPEGPLPAAFQLTLSFDPQAWVYEGFEAGDLPGFSAFNIGTQFAEEGHLTISWFQGDEQNGRLEPGVFLMRPLSGTPVNNPFTVSSAITPAIAWRSSDSKALDIELREVIPADSRSVFTVLKAAPNPFSDNATITCTLPEAGMLEIMVMDACGQSICEQSGYYPAGWNEVFLSLNGGLPGGLYYVRLTYAGDSKTMVLIRQ